MTVASAPTVIVGGTIGSYRILAKLGEGGMGAVYSAEHTLLRRRAAIKVLLPELSTRPDVVERFFNEARASTAIGDLGVVQVFDFGYHVDGSAFIVMELLEGESLDARIRRVGMLSVRDALRLMRQLAQTLATVHAKGVIHRDLKPDNVFLVSDSEAEGGERPKILDFGIAKLSEGEHSVSQTRTGSLMGTPLYMSPEQCRGAGNINPRSDIYALGCVMFHVLCGRPPFDGEGPGDVLIKHVTVTPSPPSSLRPGTPPAVDALVLRCLAKSPEDRFQDMAELAQAVAMVQAQVTGSPLAAVSSDWRRMTPAPPAPTTLSSASGASTATARPSASRGRLLAAGIAIVVAATIAIVFVSQRSGTRAAATPALDASIASIAAIDAGVSDAVIDAVMDARSLAASPQDGRVEPVTSDAQSSAAAPVVDAGVPLERKVPKPRRTNHQEPNPYALPTP